MLYTTTDVARQLTAVAVAMLSTSAAHGGTNVEYCRGVLDTARAQALGYGIPWPAVEAELQAALELLNGCLVPGDTSTWYDDSDCLETQDG